ncbi:hypothetical protein ANN_12552 [Periplaneta americana]|uniref:Uncharacterized protein n=1 Tax=Periplaneta americana TaxID=6978 RepID=A0ABQ8TIT6_PERAM|nr:hypothetical protein ANN_12552 [Periplaneta americana]
MGNACYYSVEKLLSSSLLSKNLKVRIYKTVILPVLLYGCETWTLTLREEHRFRVFENKVSVRNSRVWRVSDGDISEQAWRPPARNFARGSDLSSDDKQMAEGKTDSTCCGGEGRRPSDSVVLRDNKLL